MFSQHRVADFFAMQYQAAAIVSKGVCCLVQMDPMGVSGADYMPRPGAQKVAHLALVDRFEGRIGICVLGELWMALPCTSKGHHVKGLDL